MHRGEDQRCLLDRSWRENDRVFVTIHLECGTAYGRTYVRAVSETKLGTFDTEETAPDYVADAQSKVLVAYTPNWWEAVIIRRSLSAHIEPT